MDAVEEEVLEENWVNPVQLETEEKPDPQDHQEREVTKDHPDQWDPREILVSQAHQVSKENRDSRDHKDPPDCWDLLVHLDCPERME